MNISEVMPNGNVRVVVPIRLRKTVQGRVITVAGNVRTVQIEVPHNYGDNLILAQVWH